MTDRITETLKKLNIKEYIINDLVRESAELFFIRKKLDQRRMKDSHVYSVVVYKDFEKDNRRCKGHATAVIYPGMTDEEIFKALKSADLSASFVCNRSYELPVYSGIYSKKGEAYGENADIDFDEGCRVMTEALFAEDNGTGEADPFVNSAELFVCRQKRRIITSAGAVCGYDRFIVRGEYVIQCKKPEDVETFGEFEYRTLNADALRKKIGRTLEYTKARSLAKHAPAAGKYDVIVSGDFVRTIFDYYVDRAAADYIYAGYSKFRVGSDVKTGKDEKERTGDPLTIVLKADVPFSPEAIPMKDRIMVENDILKTIHGGARFSYYLGTEPTGNYSDIEVKPGSLSIDEMKKRPYLHVVNFSDFQMDSLTGHFGGEIRLAFLFDGEREIPVTGGSVNGSIFDVQADMRLSSEIQEERGYTGPFAVLLKDVSVAGEQ